MHGTLHEKISGALFKIMRKFGIITQFSKICKKKEEIFVTCFHFTTNIIITNYARVEL